MFHCKKAIMKCPRYEATMVNKMEKSSAAVESKVLNLKASPVKEPIPIKPQCPPAGVTTVLSLNNTTRAVHNKENSTSREQDRNLDEGFEDSGYLSLHNSHIDDHHGDTEDEHSQGKPTVTQPYATATHQEKTISPNNSPSKYKGRTDSNPLASLVTASTPVDCQKRTAAHSLSSTPSDHHNDPNLPILNFQRAVCEELAKSYKKNKRYDWSIVSKVAEDHLLDRVIGGQMGREYVDIFSCLLSRNMRSILTNILALLGDMDLISCRKVSKTWRKIICEDTPALSRCQRAERALRDSKSSLRQRSCSLTRDVAVSRVVLSCMQTLASSGTPSSSSSSTPSCRVNRPNTHSQKHQNANNQCTRFNEYMQAASRLKQHESLRPCKRCGSPATHSPEVQRATCTRPSCRFDFCTHCQEAFHNSTPCRVVQPRPYFTTPKTTPILPGSARSKRNVRRL
ncbi:F-box only protein 5 [Etheostoma cragini]|uniref:F-box only protein 5 n=1 Tax=Etheostoma cragini TaxID=417921 RepID=UPI00155EA8A9|nr:F-box only protein 5 [Etheostoma cragini]